MGVPILTVAATVNCSHQGDATTPPINSRVKIDGSPVVLAAANVYGIKGCKLPPNLGGPCVTGTWTSGATRVTVNGVPVLATSLSTCQPTGTPMLVLQVQARVTAL